MDARTMDLHTQAWAEAINQSGAAYLTPATLDGQWMVRVSVGSLNTEAADVAAVWDVIRRTAESMAQAETAMEAVRG